MAVSEATTRNKMAICILFFVLAAVAIFSSAAEAKDPQLVPRRLSSSGDSITLAANAESFRANPHASWVNGYYGYWQWISGLTNVKSHNQRITANWGNMNRMNFINAFAGASMRNFSNQARKVVAQNPHYVTVMLGHNDVCQEQPWMIPPDDQFEAWFREGMGILSEGLPAGATVYVVSTVDIRRLWDVAKYKKALGVVDCLSVWSLDRFPCDSMLHPSNTEADREYVQSRNIAFNAILQRVTQNYEEKDQQHHYYFTDTPFTYPFVESDVSDIDCFHPSAQGQRTLSAINWNAGPFSSYQKGN